MTRVLGICWALNRKLSKIMHLEVVMAFPTGIMRPFSSFTQYPPSNANKLDYAFIYKGLTSFLPELNLSKTVKNYHTFSQSTLGICWAWPQVKSFTNNLIVASNAKKVSIFKNTIGGIYEGNGRGPTRRA